MENIEVKIQNVNAWYESNQALKNISFDIPRNRITAFIGPSGCGKTTLLRSINRLNDLIDGFKLNGLIEVENMNVYANNKHEYVEGLRKSIGMVFQSSNPLPMSILDNLTLPLKEHYHLNHDVLVEKAIEKLKQVSLYDEVKNHLKKSALRLSGGQQQRLCIARTLMLEPKIILFDEPCSALDPISTYKIEDLLMEFKKAYTIIIVTHNMQQAMRISDYTSFFYQGEVVEYGETHHLFMTPKSTLLQKYVKGEF